MSIFWFAVLDSTIVIFSLVVGMWLGKLYYPNFLVSLVVFLLLRIFFYWYWFFGIKGLKLPWLKLGIHSALYVLILPISLGIISYVLRSVPNLFFWFGILPLVYVGISYLLHKYIPLYS